MTDNIVNIEELRKKKSDDIELKRNIEEIRRMLDQQYEEEAEKKRAEEQEAMQYRMNKEYAKNTTNLTPYSRQKLKIEILEYEVKQLKGLMREKEDDYKRQIDCLESAKGLETGFMGRCLTEKEVIHDCSHMPPPIISRNFHRLSEFKLHVNSFYNRVEHLVRCRTGDDGGSTLSYGAYMDLEHAKQIEEGKGITTPEFFEDFINKIKEDVIRELTLITKTNENTR